MHVREAKGGEGKGSKGELRTQTTQENKSTVQLKKGERKQIQHKSFSP